MTNRYQLYIEEAGKVRPYSGRVHPDIPWEDTAYVIVDTRPGGTRYDAGNVVVARYDEGTAFPNNPLTQAWTALDKLNKEGQFK